MKKLIIIAILFMLIGFSETNGIRIPYKSPAKAVLLSALIPGGGQLYNEQGGKFVKYFVFETSLFLAGSYCITKQSKRNTGLGCILLGTVIVMKIEDMVKVYKGAKKINKYMGYKEIIIVVNNNNLKLGFTFNI